MNFLPSLLRTSRVMRAVDASAGGTAATKKMRGIRFGNPWRDDYPEWIWRSLKVSRKDKDIFACFFKLINATRIYEVCLKDNRRYCMFVMGTGLVSSWMWSEWWNSVWRRVNKGKLYNDVPYIYPEED
ncbi:ubiquinol-cytochrome c family reductase uqcrx qcr9-like protein [Cystoisospora suis]|uniref:Ubiquinol-cytochrome c family reductase uqcrx qcr9-like protein n=1 Tax=Cystoisospora suis TaxID=483139 RepID=A0A2C6KEQ0_9APIC|nr:ubiquinol-cytochrome c family reductase uqcrx qcr9-like protein [Cystoisospora suis]